MKKLALIFLITLHGSWAVLYSINITEFNRMPPQFRMDNYDKCLNEPDGVYCAVEFSLVSDEPSDLLTTIQEYSMYTIRHFNHTKPYYGVCVTQSCQKYIHGETVDQGKVLEACLNKSLWDEYKLKTKVHNNFECTKANEEMDIDIGDIAVVLLIVIILAINVIASLYDILYVKGEEKNANKYLINFSWSRNVKKLVDVSDRSDPRQNRLRSLNGIKTISITGVIIGHSILPLIILCQNVFYLERVFENYSYQLFFNGTIIVQVFFLISALLLSYNLQIASETKHLNWMEVPKRIGLRWLRLTPPYVVVLAVNATWLRYAASGPFWKKVVNESVTDCRQSWWSHLIYINNYYDNGQCMPHAWYLAADLQLHIIGLIVCILCKGVFKKLVLAGLFVVGVIAPALHTYFQDLNGTLLLTFEAVRKMFVTDPTFVHVYKPAHTNLASFVIGLTLGLVIYSMQTRNFDVKKYKKYLPLYYAMLPTAICIIFVGVVGYKEGPLLSIYIRVLFAALLKPLFAACFAGLIIGMVFKMDRSIRGFLEARVWIVLCRLSYCAFICHEFFFRTFTGSSLMMRSDVIHMLTITLGNVLISFFVGAFIWLLVEAPFLGVIDTIRARQTKPRINGKEPAIETVEANTLI